MRPTHGARSCPCRSPRSPLRRSRTEARLQESIQKRPGTSGRPMKQLPRGPPSAPGDRRARRDPLTLTQERSFLMTPSNTNLRTAARWPRRTLLLQAAAGLLAALLAAPTPAPAQGVIQFSVGFSTFTRYRVNDNG